MTDELIANNRAWSAARQAADPNYFKRLVGQQSPRYLWIGCADSRVPANDIVGLDPGELFVHRNVANLAPPQDANYLSVLQYAVEVLGVRDIMVVGHYGCGGVKAAVDGHRHGLIDHWLSPIREVWADHRDELDAMAKGTRLNRLCELNVMRQVRNVASDVIVREAWRREQPLRVHGWVYSLENGLVTDLDCSLASLDDVLRLYGPNVSSAPEF
jgi:carbonic anhydrase